MARNYDMAETESERFRWMSEDLIETALGFGNPEARAQYIAAAQVQAINGLSAAIENMEEV